MLSAICFKLDQSKILSSGNGLNENSLLTWLLWNKKLRYCHNPGVISVGISMGVGGSVTKFNIQHTCF